MDYFLTTYKKDFKWPVIRSSAQQKKEENEKKMMELQLKSAEPCRKGVVTQPMVQSEVTPGQVVPAQPGATPTGEGSKYGQPNVYLRKLYMKYPYLYDVMKLTTPDEMAKRIMTEKYKTTYQIEYNKEEFHPANDYTVMMDIVETAEKTKERDKTQDTACTPGGSAPPKCKCAQGLSFAPCKCSKDAPVRKIAWKPAPISKMPQAPREKKKKKEDEQPKSSGEGGHQKLKPFCTEYNDTISKIGGIIIKKKLLYKDNNQDEDRKKA